MRKILIVDDSSTARMFIRRCLEMAGCRGADFHEAENGRQALDFLRDMPVDFILADLNMPVLDGKKMLRRIKSSPKTFDIPVVVISSASNPATDVEMTALGAYAVLCKPISPSLLMSSIGALLKKEEPLYGSA
jgi:two-component system, chemotaxis family, chemotaxis protein CheY